MHRTSSGNVSCAIIFALLSYFTLSASSLAQTGACCSPEGDCSLKTAWQCSRDGGVFAGVGTECDVSGDCDPDAHGIHMSVPAARRLLRHGAIHVLQVDHPNDVYAADHAMWDLLSDRVVIACQIGVNLRAHVGETMAESAQLAAASLIAQVAAAKEAWDNGPNEGKPFHWALRLDAFGVPQVPYQGPAPLPVFSNHAGDVIEGKLPRHRAFAQEGTVATVTGSYKFTVSGDLCSIVLQAIAADEDELYEDYFTEPWPLTITVGGDSAPIVGFDPLTCEFELDSTQYTGTLSASAPFTITRADMGRENGVWPCYFFHYGHIEMDSWVPAFVNALPRTGTVYDWNVATELTGISDPVAVVIGDEDIDLAGVDFANYLDYLNHPRADRNSEEYVGDTIDGTNTLQEWHALYARDRNGDPLTSGNPPMFSPPSGGPYSPLNEDLHSYLQNTYQTAYNRHRFLSAWQYFGDKWPATHLTQYLQGDSYGRKATVGDPYREVPVSPGESSYHGQSTWHGSVCWDAYYCITNPAHSLWTVEDVEGGVVPLGYNSAWYTTGEAGAGSDLLHVPVQAFGPPQGQTSGSFNPTGLVSATTPLILKFTSPGPNQGLVVRATSWASGTLTLDSSTPLADETVSGDEFTTYYVTFTAIEYLVGGIKWPMMASFCARYGESVDAAGFKSAAKKWAADCAPAQTRALPDKPFCVYYSAGSVSNGIYDGQPELVSRLATYPYEPFTTTDGWLDGSDWGQIGSQAMDYGVNCFMWFQPDLTVGGNPQLVMDRVATAIADMDVNYTSNFVAYTSIACIADWDMDDMVTMNDGPAFATSLQNDDYTADLNNDGVLGPDDQALYDAVMCMGGCAPIDDPGCTGNGDCEDADWCDDGTVGVPDIFCFLADWFALDPVARNYGGTPGVPAIFAFLSNWFAWGTGPCEP